MSARKALFQIWAGDASTLDMGASELADEVGCEPSSVNVYRSQFRKLNPLSSAQVAAGKKLRSNEQKRRWRIEEACNALIEEGASLHDMQSAGLQFVVLKVA